MHTHIYAKIPVVLDKETGQYYFEVHHTRDASLRPKQQNKFIISTDITINTQQQLGTNLTLFADQYDYDSSVGMYGGYKLRLYPDDESKITELISQ